MDTMTARGKSREELWFVAVICRMFQIAMVYRAQADPPEPKLDVPSARDHPPWHVRQDVVGAVDTDLRF